MNILGLNSAGFNTASSLFTEKGLVFAVEEERLIREKRCRAFPARGVEAALDFAGLDFKDLDAIAIGWNPSVNLESFNLPQAQRARYLGEILYSTPMHLMRLRGGGDAAMTRQTISFLEGPDLDVHYINHHICHAAAFLMSPFDEAAIMTVDAFGEKQSSTFATGRGGKVEQIWSQEFPHSLGSFYEVMTDYCGFMPQNDEWKLMGASSYGDPERFLDAMRSLIRFEDGGGFTLDLPCFNHFQFHRSGWHTPEMEARLGLPPNRRDEPLTQDYYDLAASAQRMAEEVYFHLLNALHARTGLKSLVLSGGVALNSVANGKIYSETPFEDVFIPPVPDDSGCSVGAALYLRHHIEGAPRDYVMETNYLGPGFGDDEIRAELDRWKVRYEVAPDPSAAAAALVADGNIIGWFQGRLEFGDRALGNRSILADPRDVSMKDKVNATIKYREPFRPFAPSILAEAVDEYFVDARPTPFMEKVFPIRPEKRQEIPAVTHIDGTGRLQTVSREGNERYWRLIEAFRDATGVPVVLNTSFNLKGEAIVCTPHDALRTFHTSGLDALVIGDCVVRKDSVATLSGPQHGHPPRPLPRQQHENADFRIQDFETDLLGVPVGRLVLTGGEWTDAGRDLRDLVTGWRQKGVWLVWCRVPEASDLIGQLEASGFRAVETLVTFRRPLAGAPAAAGVELARPGDHEACVAIARRSFVNDRLNRDPEVPDEAATRVREAWVRKDLAGRADASFVIRADGAVAGFNLCRLDGTEAVIDLIAVDTIHQNQGLGRALVAGALAHYGAGPAETMRVGTQADNAPSIALYEGAGFQEVRRQVTLHWTNPEAAPA